MGKFFGGFFSYFLAIVLIACGVGGLFYFNKPVEVETDPVQVDISPENGYNWENLYDGMYVKLNTNNSAGYFTCEFDDNNQPINRYYYVYDYSQKSNKYNHLILVVVNPVDYKAWDLLGEQMLTNKKALNTIKVENYVHKMSNSMYKDVINSNLIEGVDDYDELQKLILPYYIGPKVAEEPKPPYFRYASFGAIGLGVLLLIISIIGSIISSRY
jgi:hypothetical protein